MELQPTVCWLVEAPHAEFKPRQDLELFNSKLTTLNEGVLFSLQNSPEKTSEVECGDFYNSGDRATVDEDGYFWFLGREDDVINASGYRIGPTEVENALAEHPAVAESAVVSSPDKNRGEVRRAQKPIVESRS
ncbi:acyl-coenzyme A synthetase ACSM1, mitochondrial-like [Psammomys obesus]|uniref:acyl-coenzyme A synthetase ACSM1, mitochondrial-like n=1 Tax=Psammomys obesus TaxID=48139 RepID=UPI002452F202|nr:acyl-coenzyme A synthetase ACSM1, mitochondrial-like [Psammomys obesus]